MTEEESRNRIRDAFNKALNAHGYGFHYAVIKRAVSCIQTVSHSGYSKLQKSRSKSKVLRQGLTSCCSEGILLPATFLPSS